MTISSNGIAGSTTIATTKAWGGRFDRARVVQFLGLGRRYSKGDNLKVDISNGRWYADCMGAYRSSRKDLFDWVLRREALRAFVDTTRCGGLSNKNVAGILGLSPRSLRHWDSRPSKGRGVGIRPLYLARMIRLMAWVQEGRIDLSDIREIRWGDAEISRWDDSIDDDPVRPHSGSPYMGLSGDSPYREFCEIVGKDALGGGRLLGLSSRQEGRARDFWHNRKQLDARFLARIVILLKIHYDETPRRPFDSIYAVNWDDGLLWTGEDWERDFRIPLPAPDSVRMLRRMRRISESRAWTARTWNDGLVLLSRMRRISESRARTVPKLDDIVRMYRAAMRLDPNRHRIFKPYIPMWDRPRYIKRRMLGG